MDMFKPNTERIPRRQPFPLKKNISKGSAQKIFGVVMMIGVCGGVLLGSPFIGSRKPNITGNLRRPEVAVEKSQRRQPHKRVLGEIQILENPTVVKND